MRLSVTTSCTALPQTNASVTIAVPDGSPSPGNGNSMASGLMVTFRQGALKAGCPSKPAARLGDILAPTWTGGSPSP